MTYETPATTNSSTLLDLSTYRNGSSEISIPLTQESPKLSAFLRDSLFTQLEVWDTITSHAKERHGDEGKNAVSILHENLASSDPRYQAVIKIGGDKLRKESSALITTQRPINTKDETLLCTFVGSYIALQRAEAREEVLKSLMLEGLSFSDKIMFAIAALIGGLNPLETISFTQAEKRKVKEFIPHIAKLKNQINYTEEPFVQEVLKAGVRSGISALEGALTKRHFSLAVEPRVFMIFDYQHYALGKGVKTAYIRRRGISKGIPRKAIRSLIYGN